MVVFAGMPHRDGEVVGPHIHHVEMGGGDDLLRVLIAQGRFDMRHDHRGLVGLPQPRAAVRGPEVVHIAVAGGSGARPVWGELHVIYQGHQVLARFGARELDPHDAGLQQTRDLGPVQLTHLGDDGHPVVPGAEYEVRHLAAIEKRVFLLDVDEIEARVAIDLDQRRTEIFGHHAGQKEVARLETPFEGAPKDGGIVVDGVMDTAGFGHGRSPV